MPRVSATFHALGRTYVEGDEVPDTDPAVKRYPSFFPAVVEQATAAPGEKRSARPRKATSA